MSDFLSLSNLRTQFDTERGAVKAVDGVDLTIREGETVGLVAGVVATLAFFFPVHPDDLPRASARAFSLAAIALGFGVLGWSGSIFAGRGFEEMQRHLDTGTDWTEEDSRRAMARISGFGAGVILATTLL